MESIAIILLVIGGLVGLEWVGRNLLVLRVWRSAFHLRPDSPTLEGSAAKISIVVAAKDEEANIETCLRSLLAQDYPNFDLLVVNDRSDDRTAEIVERIAAEDDRLRLLNIEKLPDGWCGKNHAMQRGIENTDGEWIFMTDADCRYTCPKTLSLAMRQAQDRRAEMISLLPTLEMGGFWERFLLPICSGVLMIWFQPNKVNDPRKPHAYANGMFMLIVRDAYEAIGTHEAFKGSLIEDMDLARAIKESGRNLQVVPSEDLFRVRMYTRREQIDRGWVRIFLGSFRTLPRLVAALLVLIGRGLTPFATTLLAAIGYFAQAEPHAVWLAALCVCGLGLIAQIMMTMRFYKHAGCHWAYGLLYPVGCGYVAGLILKTMTRHLPGAKITWRDTTYNADQ